MSDATLHQDIETPKASGADIKRFDADTVVGLGDSKNQAIARCAHCRPALRDPGVVFCAAARR